MDTAISLPLTAIAAKYDVVVIGSGYGGAIAACRLAQARKGLERLRVCLLERGQERRPGSYPTTLSDFEAMAQFSSRDKHVGPRDGLFEFHTGGDVAVLAGCGLGGTSLINTGVCIEPKAWVLQDPSWPAALRADQSALLAGMARARTMLGTTAYPAHAPIPRKLQALQQSATALGANCLNADVNITFAAGTNAAGLAQDACDGCGDCVTGCNRNAKNTTLVNYLPMARRHGAEIFCQAEVDHLARRDDHWLVYYRPLQQDRSEFTDELPFVIARQVFLGAGTLGSTEILLRSKALGLAMSDQVGHHFSSNGEVLAFGYNTEFAIGAVGTGDAKPDPANPPGPGASGLIDLRDAGATPEDGIIIQDAVLPSAFAADMPAVLASAATSFGVCPELSTERNLARLLREAESLLPGSSAGAIAHTQTYLALTHDRAQGLLTLGETGRAHIVWPEENGGAGPLEIGRLLQRASFALGGTYVASPIASKLAGSKRISCHPLGGCVMADSADHGVVDAWGRVFSGPSGGQTWPGLIVCDGSVIPRSLGAHPLLTIAGLAERTLELWLSQEGYVLSEELPPLPNAATGNLGLRFTEKITGTLGLGQTDGYDPSQWNDQVRPCNAVMVVQVESDDIDQVLNHPTHLAALTGTISLPGIDDQPLQLQDGEFQLFIQDPDNPAGRTMNYRFRAVTTSGDDYYFSGEKLVSTGDSSGPVHDTTTLYVDLYRGTSVQGLQIGRGILKVHLLDLAASLKGLQVLGTHSLLQKTEISLRCARFFFGALADTYL